MRKKPWAWPLGIGHLSSQTTCVFACGGDRRPFPGSLGDFRVDWAASGPRGPPGGFVRVKNLAKRPWGASTHTAPYSAPSPGRGSVGQPNAPSPRPPPSGLSELSQPASSSASGGENRESGQRRTPQPLGMLRGGTGSVAAAAWRARLPSPRAAAPAATIAAPGPRTPSAEAGAEGCHPAERGPRAPPCPSFPGGPGRGGAGGIRPPTAAAP